MEATDVLRERMQQPGGLNRMITLSIAVHALFATAIIFAPGGLLHQKRTPPTVITIRLGGSGEGPDPAAGRALARPAALRSATAASAHAPAQVRTS